MKRKEKSFALPKRDVPWFTPARSAIEGCRTQGEAMHAESLSEEEEKARRSAGFLPCETLPFRGDRGAGAGLRRTYG